MAEKGENRRRFYDLHRSSAVWISDRTPFHKRDTVVGTSGDNGCLADKQ